jgi:hypothetical protein
VTLIHFHAKKSAWFYAMQTVLTESNLIQRGHPIKNDKKYYPSNPHGSNTHQW